MRISRTILTIVIAIFISYRCFAQAGLTVLPFLTIPPTTEANGMGAASVANPTDDPLAVIMNPAQLGMLSQTKYFSSGYDFTNWFADVRISTYTVNAGVNLKTFYENAPSLSVGVGYSRLFIDYGSILITTEAYPDGIGLYNPWESSDQFSFGIGFDYWIKVSGGATFKHIRSDIFPPEMPGIPTPTTGDPGRIVPPMSGHMGKASLYDYGFLVDVPFVGIVSKLSGTSFEVGNGLSPFFDGSIGFSKNNLGQEGFSYDERDRKFPFPRYAREGIGVELGLVSSKEFPGWKPLSFKRTIEAADVLVDRNGQYLSGMGDIHFTSDIIEGHTNTAIEKKNGWELNLMEIVSIRGGRFEDGIPGMGRRFNSSGWGLRLSGVPKLLRALGTQMPTSGITGFLIDHVDVRYNHSSWDADDANSPLMGVKFDSINLSITN